MTLSNSIHMRVLSDRQEYSNVTPKLINYFLILFFITGIDSVSSLQAEVPEQMDEQKQAVVSTFSIVAYDPVAKEWGIGVASKFLAVGHVVPWAKAGQGAIATQSYANTTYGPQGLRLLKAGAPASEVIKVLIDSDPMRANRQVGIVDQAGEAATFTGEKCLPWAGGKTGDFYACQGNILAGPEVIDDMTATFENAQGPLAWRIMDALVAADDAGGDIRGRQSAAILIVKENAGYAGLNDRMIDFRVDDHETPLKELSRILSLKLKRPELDSEASDDEETTEQK